MKTDCRKHRVRKKFLPRVTSASAKRCCNVTKPSENIETELDNKKSKTGAKAHEENPYKNEINVNV